MIQTCDNGAHYDDDDSDVAEVWSNDDGAFTGRIYEESVCGTYIAAGGELAAEARLLCEAPGWEREWAEIGFRATGDEQGHGVTAYRQKEETPYG